MPNWSLIQTIVRIFDTLLHLIIAKLDDVKEESDGN